MTAAFGWLRKQLAGILALVLVLGLFLVARLPGVSAAEQDAMAGRFRFTPMTIALPAAKKSQSIRTVNKAYKNITAWISSVGAAAAMNDISGSGKADDLCLVDPRSDQVVVTPTPDSGPRYAPFALDPAPALPTWDFMAPMGCVPGDFNEDGRTDLLVYYWGRTPVLFLQKATAAKLDAAAFEPTELVPGEHRGPDGAYNGPMWNTDSATIGDFDGDGHIDIFIGNYFPDSKVLDPREDGGVAMNQSMSHATNSGGKYVYRWAGGSSGAHPSARFADASSGIPPSARFGWTLASSATDIDRDGLPELYIANDFGHDHLLYNKSTPGHVEFGEVTGVRGAGDPKSKVLGNDSFKGMGVDFGDLNHDGLYDLFVSNITTSWGIEESNFQFVNTAKDNADLTGQLKKGVAPFRDESGGTGTAWSGWGWDVKIQDFDNSGENQIAQSTGFVKGQVNRWPNLQELATANDGLVSNPFWWPNAKAGDDIAGDQTLHFFVKSADGRYTDLAPQLGLAVPVPTRGIAVGDTNGDGLPEMAVARQWEEPIFYRNDSPNPGKFLQLKLTTDAPVAPGPLPAAGPPAIGAEATVTTADGKKYLGRVDGSSGEAGRRSFDVQIGLGREVSGPLDVHLQWRDRTGQLRTQDLKLDPGRHCFRLGAAAKEM
ncbi:CRTAC1 family protein [Amycolatopsis rubida]|uniref:CRTAC1 family protein n=1 Tax=Amycolatopsis rubida TaxID=112413 RepID=A0ABX0BY42_9PSEU|nr:MULTISPECIES: VCBS repeat-containing protein [Amycolatopsis]MYW94153.1 RNA-binding protein [Amycolatopsis rubida]NEC59142.1 CRTAC1 family protein [Amycolatopsis rubida]OAP20932.1 FG-GAP repeat protein [Amycolatopsis sp. M39]